MENKRRKIHEELEVVQTGFANGVAEGFPLQQSDKDKMINEAETACRFSFVNHFIFIRLLERKAFSNSICETCLYHF